MYLFIYLFYAGRMLIADFMTEMVILHKYVWLFNYLFISIIIIIIITVLCSVYNYYNYLILLLLLLIIIIMIYCYVIKVLVYERGLKICKQEILKKFVIIFYYY